MQDLLKVEAVRKYEDLIRLRNKVRLLEKTIESLSERVEVVHKRVTSSDIIFVIAVLFLVFKTQFFTVDLADLFIYLGTVGVLLAQATYYRIARAQINSDIDRFSFERKLAMHTIERDSPQFLMLFSLDQECSSEGTCKILSDLEFDLRKKIEGENAKWVPWR